MEDYSSLTKDIASKEFLAVNRIKEKGYEQIKEFNIDCSILTDLTNQPIQFVEEYKEMFNELAQLKGPVLYVFKIVSPFDKAQIVESISKFRNGSNWKATPAIKKNIPDSDILYVGKVKKNFSGRVYQHLGYYKVQLTQGLQLYHWAKDLNLELKLTAMEFELDAANIISILENNLAQKLNPILGKHK